VRGRSALFAVAVVGLVVAVAGCSDDETAEPAEVDAPDSITVTSEAFDDGGTVPERFTCDGDEVSPPLAWDGVPDDAAALALVVDDPDAPGGTYTHWVVLDVPPGVTSVDEGGVPDGGVEVENSSGDASYAGPCPPSGTHHYRFMVYALSEETGLDPGAALDDALRAIEEAATAQGRLTATYSR